MKQGNALSLISRIREKANKFIVRELEVKGLEGIVPSHGDILFYLFQGEKYTMKELAVKIHRTKPTVTVLVEKLVHYGFVEKEKSLTDSRVTYVRLTEKGYELRPIIDDISHRLNAILYCDFTEAAAVEFEELLKKVNTSLDKIMNLP